MRSPIHGFRLSRVLALLAKRQGSSVVQRLHQWAVPTLLARDPNMVWSARVSGTRDSGRLLPLRRKPSARAGRSSGIDQGVSVMVVAASQ